MKKNFLIRKNENHNVSHVLFTSLRVAHNRANKSKWEWKSGKQYFSNEKPQSNLFFMILMSMNVKKLKFLKISLVSLLLCFICSSTFHKNSTACMLMLFCCELIEGSKINVKNNADAFNLNKEKGRILWKKDENPFHKLFNARLDSKMPMAKFSYLHKILFYEKRWNSIVVDVVVEVIWIHQR